MSRPLVTRLVPTRTSSRPSRERVDDPLGGALALDDVAVEAADPERREAVADLALDPFGAAAEVADPRRAHRPGSGSPSAPRSRSGGSAATRRLRGRRAAARTPGQAWTWPQSRHRTTDAVPRRLMTRIARSPAAGSSARAPPTSRVRQQAAVAGRELGAQVDDLDRRRQRRSDGPAARPAGSARLGPDRRCRPPAWRCRGRPPRRPAGPARSPRRGPGAAACGRSCRSLSCSSSTTIRPDVGERRQDGQPRPDDDVDLARPDPPPFVGPLPRPDARNGRARPGRRGRPGAGRRAASPGRSPGTRTSAGRPSASEAAIAST